MAHERLIVQTKDTKQENRRPKSRHASPRLPPSLSKKRTRSPLDRLQARRPLPLLLLLVRAVEQGPEEAAVDAGLRHHQRVLLVVACFVF